MSWPYHSERPLCSDRELLLTDVLYNLRCAEDIYGDQGIDAWVAVQ